MGSCESAMSLGAPIPRSRSNSGGRNDLVSSVFMFSLPTAFGTADLQSARRRLEEVEPKIAATLKRLMQSSGLSWLKNRLLRRPWHSNCVNLSRAV